MATVPHLTLVTKSNVGSPCWLRGFLWPNVSLSERCVPSLSANHVLNVCCFCVASGVCLVTPMCRPLFCGLLCLCCDFFLACWWASHNTALKTWGGCTHQSFHCVYICMHTTTCGVELSTGHTVSLRFWTTETCFSISFWPGKTRFYVCFWCVCVCLKNAVFLEFSKNTLLPYMQSPMDWP